jgi:DNA repair protein SbcC/Rad50
MIIESIKLNNIKSYNGQGCSIDFKPGVNLIWGENGSGKTTILEAIGYCLFDALDYNLDKFVREGENEGEAILTFKHQDGRSYAIVREIRNTGGLKILDVASGRYLFTRRKDAEDWLNDELGVNFGSYGKELFQNAIGVAQGKMTGSFAFTAATRKKIFDPILRVDEYDQAYKNLANTKHSLEDQLHSMQNEQSVLKDRLNKLSVTRQNFQELSDRIGIGNRNVEMAQEQLNSLAEELNSLNATLHKLQELGTEISGAEKELDNLADLLKVAETTLGEAQRGKEIVITTKPGHEKHIWADNELLKLEPRREERDRFRKQIQEVEITLSGLGQQISGLKRGLSEVEEAEKKILEIGPDVQKQIEYEAREKEAKDHIKERDRLNEEIEDWRSQFQEKNDYLEDLNKQLLQRIDLEKELHEKHTYKEKVLSEMEDLNKLIEGKRIERDKIADLLQKALLDNQTRENAIKERNELTSEIGKDQQTLNKSEEQYQERIRLEREQTTIEGEQEGLRINLAESQQELSLSKNKLDELRNHLSLLQNAESAECPVCRRSLSDIERDNVEADFTKDEQIWMDRQKNAKSIESIAKADILRCGQRLQKNQTLLKNLPGEIRIIELKEIIHNKELRMDNLDEEINQLAAIPETVIVQQSNFDSFAVTINSLNKQKGDLEDQRNLLDRTINQINRDITSLPTETIKLSILKEIIDLDGRVKNGELSVKELSNVERDLEDAMSILEKLGDPRKEQNRLAGIASRRSALEAEKRICEKDQEDAIVAQEELLSKLNAYSSLDQEIDLMKSFGRETESDYLNYERNFQTSTTLETRKTRFEELKQSRSNREVEINRLKVEKNQIGTGYDSDYHHKNQESYDELDRNITYLSAQLGVWRQQLESIASELSDLEKQREQLLKINRELERLEKLNGIFDFVRNSIKRASPDIVRKRVGAISNTADRIFQDILGDLMLVLTWDETYAIRVLSGKNERVFEQLSGGEQMAASIAIRLALLLHMSDSNIRWLFLDEPTANMDDKRRDALADRITRLDQLDQIFVITHDDAFDRDTHHLVQITKLDGVSSAINIR